MNTIRILVPLAVLVGLLAAIWSHVGHAALDQREKAEEWQPKKILERAIAAHGGRKNILKPRIGLIKGIDKAAKDGTSFETWFDFPNQWKSVQTFYVDKTKNVTFVLAKDGKVWQWHDDSKAKLAENPEDFDEPHFGLLIALTNLENGKFELSSLKEIDVEGRKAVGLRIVRKKTEAQCYFDKASGLLVRWDSNVMLEPGVLSHQKLLLDRCKSTDGVVLPYRQRVYLIGGAFKEYEQIVELLITDVEILDRLPKDTFLLQISSVGPSRRAPVGR